MATAQANSKTPSILPWKSDPWCYALSPSYVPNIWADCKHSAWIRLATTFILRKPQASGYTRPLSALSSHYWFTSYGLESVLWLAYILSSLTEGTKGKELWNPWMWASNWITLPTAALQRRESSDMQVTVSSPPSKMKVISTKAPG